MPTGGVHSGLYGVLNGISAVRNWQINDAETPAVFSNSATKQGHGRKTGIASWGGSYSAHGAIPFAFPGTSFNFQGYTAPDTDILAGIGSIYSGTAFVDALSLIWDFAGGQVMSHQCQFSGHLALTATHGAAALSDATISDPEPIGPCHIDSSPDGTTWTPVPNITQAVLNITAANSQYVNASTAGQTGRKPGLIDFSIQLTVEDTKLYAGLSKDTDYQFRMYTTASQFWLLKWVRLFDASNLQVNQETAAIVSHTMNLGMQAEVGGVFGSIKLPGASTSAWGT